MDFHGRVLRLCAATNFQTGDFESALALAKKSLRFTKDGANFSCSGEASSFVCVRGVFICVVHNSQQLFKSSKAPFSFSRRRSNNPLFNRETVSKTLHAKLSSILRMYTRFAFARTQRRAREGDEARANTHKSCVAGDFSPRDGGRGGEVSASARRRGGNHLWSRHGVVVELPELVMLSLQYQLHNTY